jgi:general secretion pathway protein N
VTKWHPATKLLLLAAVLAVPYLLWTQSDAPGPIAAPPARAASDGAAELSVPPAGALELYALPPLERFAAVVERPLFSPTRRMPPIPEPPPEVGPVADTGPAPEPLPSGPGEPELRFFGTVQQGGRSAALVTFPATNAVARLSVGDRVGAWEVREVVRNRLVLGTGDEQRTFEIFGNSTRTKLPGPRPAAAAAPDAVDPSTPADPEEPPPEDDELGEITESPPAEALEE